MNLNVLPSEKIGVVGVIDPDAYAAGTETTGWVDASRFWSFLAVILAGDLGAAATVDAKIEQAKTSGGSGAKDLTGKSITQLTKVGTDDNKQALINFRPEDLDVEGGYAFVRLSITVGTAASDVGGLLLGFEPRHSPASDYDAATVDEVVS